MADRAEMFSLSTFHSLSPPGCRPPQDISLEEFDDEDLSEITDDCGLGLSYDSDHCEKDSLSLGRSEQPHPICSFQDDFQEFEMIDVNGEEREQTHRAVFRFIPRHPDELELDVDDPVLVEAEEDDFWFRGFNMRTGERGVFPAFYAHAVPGPAKDLLGSKRSPCWVERFDVQFLGSVEVPCHQGNGILCAAMQKIATARKLTVHLRPPASCDLEISLRGVKLSLSGGGPEFQRCSHFFQMKNISFCGCHPRNSCYFGFITKHPLLSRFACHVFVSQESMRPVAQSVGRAFLEYYQEHLAYACPTEDIYLE
uniref:cDNA FLJ54593, highly similar to C-jun-amino-terminal kinase-interactingprotein 2 n=1 Tax=Homo sapiens TaxID=9606 RepID=B4DED9_HUMAN|nr:unnamed protein product [Homo sapiens]